MTRLLLFAICFTSALSVARCDTVVWSRIESEVDITDLNNVRNNFGMPGGLGDYTDDGWVDIRDLNYVRNRFGAPYEPRPNQILPEQPTTLDEIRFHLQHEAQGDACDATRTYGIPFLAIDEALRAVLVDFAPLQEPIACTDGNEGYTDGLDGTFGPLSAGRWALGFAGAAPTLEFDVVQASAVPEPSTWVSALTGLCAAAALRRRFHRTTGASGG